jgi:hypothetical protein
MALILTRSPYHISRANLDSGAVMTLEIGEYSTGTFDILKSYTLSFRSKLFIDISPLIRDYLQAEYEYSGGLGRYLVSKGKKNIVYVRTTINGTEGGGPPEGGAIINEYFATDGYLYGTDSFNEDKSNFLTANSYYTGSSDTIYKLDGSNIRITLLKAQGELISNPPVSSEIIYLDFYNGSELKRTDTYTANKDDSESYCISAANLSVNSYRDRVLDSGGTLEDSECLDSFIEIFRLNEFTKIVIRTDTSRKTLKVNTISECKYDPYRITFKNRFGADEDLWFFKKSAKSLKTMKEDFRSNEFKAYNAGELTRQIQQYNKNGKESLVINSGFVVEELNESFKQLMLSEEVSLYDFNNNTFSAINITDSEIEFKTVTNDKLINYTINVEFSNDVINNIV